MDLPEWHRQHDQGKEGACVGFAWSMAMAILNEKQARKNKIRPYTHMYNARWLWNEAKKIDVWPDTNPGDDNGTSVRAAGDVLRKLGHVRIIGSREYPADVSQGIKENRWAVSVDEVRTCISKDIPVVIGVSWYTNFDNPTKKGGKYFIGEGDLGKVRGGHAVCIYGASDKLKAFKVKNSWGRDYPLVWMKYETLERLLNEKGEVTLISDL